jgi:nitrilase
MTAPPDLYPVFKAAAVQAAPVFLDTEATIEKTRALIAEAAGNGASLIAFPEVFVPGYPYWNWTLTPLEGSPWFERLVRAAVTIDGPEVAQLCDAAREFACHVVIGVNERASYSVGTLYNTVLVIDDTGALLGVHRKLVPTFAEKLTWAPGDGSGLTVHRTKVGALGALACGENTNTLARFALLAQGELVHVANYIAMPAAPPDYDMVEAIKLRAAAHSFEGKVFTIVSCSALTPAIVEQVADGDDDVRRLLARPHTAFSGAFGPDGRLITRELVDEEGIVYADIDLGKCIQPKQIHDIVGHYNRFDVFDLRMNKRPLGPIEIDGGG